MKNSSRTLLAISIVTLLSCNTKEKKAAVENQEKEEVVSTTSEPSKAELLVAETITAHGGERYATAHYGFRFRDKAYTFKNDTNSYRYTVRSVKELDSIHDVLENGKLMRKINGKSVSLSKKDDGIFTEALNSVIYFATLPSKLQDKAVKKTYSGEATIKGQDYQLLGVTFNQEGGGKDYDDKFMYWINADTKIVEYLAYSYSTNDGGVRFRSAFNPRTIEGVHFQDYINYEVAIGTPLTAIPDLYEKGNLKELSKILTEDVYKIE